MAAMKVNDSNFQAEVVGSEVPVLVDFWAPWCGPCRAIAPHVEALSEAYEGRAKVVKVNIDESPETAQQFRVMSIPTLLLFNGGQVVGTQVGNLPGIKNKLAQMLDAAL